jgi:hypothetical protein
MMMAAEFFATVVAELDAQGVRLTKQRGEYVVNFRTGNGHDRSTGQALPATAPHDAEGLQQAPSPRSYAEAPRARTS